MMDLRTQGEDTGVSGRMSGYTTDASNSSETSMSPPEAASPDTRKRKRTYAADDSESSAGEKELPRIPTPAASDSVGLDIFNVAANVSS